VQHHVFELLSLVAALALPACSAGPSSSQPDEADRAAPSLPPRDAGAHDELATDASVSGDAAAFDAGVGAGRDASASSDGAAPARMSRASLVMHELWTRVEPQQDPFDDRPPLVECRSAASMAETLNSEPVFSVDTESCNYLTVTQRTLRDVAAGETLKVRLWHFALSAPAPAEAHAAVVIDGLFVLDERVPIPHDGELIPRQLTVTRAIPAGAAVYFHLHNHGGNSWALVEVSSGS
jgi:hypothetical protein